MVNVNKKYLKEKLKHGAWNALSKELEAAKSPREIEGILSNWLTADEMTMLEKRLAIKTLIKEGVRHNEIKRILDVSSHTITSVKKRKQKRGAVNCTDGL